MHQQFVFLQEPGHWPTPETHKELKRVTLICLLCPMLVIIHFRKWHIWNEKKRWLTNQTSQKTWRNFTSGSRARLKKWPTNGGNTPKSRESFQRLKPGILPKHWAGYYCLTTRAKHNIMKPTDVLTTSWTCHFKKRCLVDPLHSKLYCK